MQAPLGATWARVRVRSLEQAKSARFVLHCVQLAPQLVYTTYAYKKMFTLNEQAEMDTCFAVTGETGRKLIN